MPDPEELPDSSSCRFHCPGCQEEVDVTAELAGKLVRCPYCNIDFFASHEQSHLPVVDDTELNATTAELDRESAFDKLRIENFTALRMGAIRARSWWLIALCLSLLTIADMASNTVLYIYVFHRVGIIPLLRIIVAIAAILIAKHARERARAYKNEIDKSTLPEPAIPPDFSTLSNGTDRWKHLDNVR